MFVARNHELEALNAAYETPGFQMSVVYGRRRVGKTRLLRKFAEDKPRTIFLTSLESTAADNLAALSRSIYRADVTDRTANSDLADASFPRFPSFEDALRSIFVQARERRLLLIVDEYPYLAGSYPGISSLLQSLIDEHKETSRLHLILCGSSMSFMEHQVLGHKSPLYGRRTMQLKVKPFDYLDASKMLPDANPTHIIELYAIVGGIPLYLEQLDSANSTEWNIANRVLPTGALLNAEPLNYLLQEVRNPATYNAIIAAIARGRVRPAEIGDAIRIDRARVDALLKNLIELLIVTRTEPVLDPNRKKVQYRISDNLFRFWYTFMPKYGSLVEAGRANDVARRMMKKEFPAFVGPAFEDICQQWIMRQVGAGDLDILPREIGSWWGTDPRTRTQEEIDIVAPGIDGELLLGECKWRNEEVDVNVLDRLVERSEIFMAASKQLYLFAKAGFTDTCRAHAKRMGNVQLVELEELFAGK